MTAPVTFAPAPRLAYTLRYNEIRENYHRYLLEQQRHNKEQERIRLEHYQETQRLEENRRMRETITEMNLYSHLGNLQANREYKYAYWVSSLVDRYI